MAWDTTIASALMLDENPSMTKLTKTKGNLFKNELKNMTQ
jgi:hypothetical protein